MTYSADEKMNCARRELHQRARVYPRLVANGKMTPDKSLHEMAMMAEIVEDYRTLATKERLI